MCVTVKLSTNPSVSRGRVRGDAHARRSTWPWNWKTSWLIRFTSRPEKVPGRAGGGGGGVSTRACMHGGAYAHSGSPRGGGGGGGAVVYAHEFCYDPFCKWPQLCRLVQLRSAVSGELRRFERGCFACALGTRWAFIRVSCLAGMLVPVCM